MAGITFVAGTASTINASSYASGSFTPAANDLLVVFVHASGTIAADAVLTDSQNLGFSLVGKVADGTNVNTSYIFVAQNFAAASAMTVTFGCVSDSATGSVIEVYRISGMSRVGSMAVRQVATSPNQASGGTPAVTFGQAVLTGNPTLGFVSNATSPATLTPPTSWTEGNDTGYSTPTTGMEVVSRASGFTGTTITWGSTSGSAFAAGAIELDTSALTAGDMVQTVNGANTLTTDLVLTPKKAITNNNLVIVAVNENNNPSILTGVTDSAGNTYHKMPSASAATGGTHNNTLTTFYAYAISGAPTTITIQKGGGSAGISAVATEYYWQDTADPLDKTVATGSSGTAISSGATATLSQANELVVGFEADDVGTGQAIALGGSFQDAMLNDPASGMVTMADEIVSATTAVTFTATLFSSTDNVGAVATFKIPAGSPPTISASAPTLRIPNPYVGSQAQRYAMQQRFRLQRQTVIFGTFLNSTTQAAIARIAITGTFTQTAIARIANNPTKTQTAIARIANVKTKTQTAVARIANNITKTQPTVSRIAVILTKTQTATADIKCTVTKTQSATADIKCTATKTQSAIARIANNFTKTQTATARIGQSGTKTQTAIARIANTTTKTQTAIARIQKAVTKTQTAVARIDNPETKTQTAIARIANNFTKTQTAIARIANNFTKTQTAKARIANVVSKTQTSTARIDNPETKIQTAVARIANVKTKTQTAVANIIQATAGSKTQSAKARIANTFTKTQSAIGRIAVILSRTQPAKARLANNLSLTQAAKARIDQPEQAIQTAKARLSMTFRSSQMAKAYVVQSTSTSVPIILDIADDAAALNANRGGADPLYMTSDVNTLQGGTSEPPAALSNELDIVIL